MLVQSALLYTDAKLVLIDEPDAHLHALLTEKIYRLILEHCDVNDCQVLIATHSSRFIEEANENGNILFLVTASALKPVPLKEARDLLGIFGKDILLAETTQRVLYLEGKSDLELLREWAKVLDHPAIQRLNRPFWIATAEQNGRNFSKRHY